METFLNNIRVKRIQVLMMIFLGVLSIYVITKIINEAKTTRFIGSGTTATNTIVVSGTGDASSAPDIATITFGVESTMPKVADAEKAVNDKSNAAIAAVKASGVADKDIKLENNSFYPQYDYGSPCYGNTMPCPARSPKITGYQVSRSVSIKVRNLDTAPSIVEKLAAIGVTNLNGPIFSLDKEDSIHDAARKIAIDNAKAKADVLAKQLGVTLVRVVNFSENNGGYPMPMMYEKAMGGATDSAVPPTLPQGENKYTSNVTITYEIK